MFNPVVLERMVDSSTSVDELVVNSPVQLLKEIANKAIAVNLNVLYNLFILRLN